MVGIIFLISIVLFLSAVLCQWLVSSREKSTNSFLYAWFPFYALVYAGRNHRSQKAVSLFVFISFAFVIITLIAWVIAYSSIESKTVENHWVASISENTLKISDSDSLFPDRRVVITGKGLNYDISGLTAENSLKGKDYSVVLIERDSATKTLDRSLQPIHQATFLLKADRLIVSLETGSGVQSYNAVLKQEKSKAPESLTYKDIKKRLGGFDSIRKREVTYKVGTIQQISEKQSIAGLKLLNGSVLLKEITLTFDYRNGDYHLNNRSMLVLRKFFSELRKSKKSIVNSKLLVDKELDLTSFTAMEDAFLNKSVVLIKRDGNQLRGLFQSTEKQKVINITQSLGAGTVVVQTPLTLVERFEFSDTKVLMPSETESGVGEEELTQDVLVEVEEHSIGSITSERFSQFTSMIGKQVLIYRIDGQKRSGRLKTVEPGKYITLEQLQGGLEVRIPEPDIDRFEVLE